MIAGLEFTRSWRYWAVLLSMTSAIVVGSAGVHIALNLYLPAIAIEPHEFYSDLGSFAVTAIAIGIYWFALRQDKQKTRIPEGYEFWLMLVSGFSTGSIILLEWVAVDRLIVEPIIPDAPGSIYSGASQIAAIFLGWWIAKKEWAVMTGVGVDTGESVTPDSS